MATTTPATGGTALSRHDCPCCGAPISLRQEAIGEALLRLATLTAEGMDLDGDCTPVYCVACLEVMLDADGRRAELARLEAFLRELDDYLRTLLRAYHDHKTVNRRIKVKDRARF